MTEISYLKRAKTFIEKSTFFNKNGTLFYIGNHKHKNFIVNIILPDQDKSVLFTTLDRKIMINFAYIAFKYINPLTFKLPYFIYTYAVSDEMPNHTYSFYTKNVGEDVEILKFSETEKIELLLHMLYAHTSVLEKEKINVNPRQGYFFKRLDSSKLFPVFDPNDEVGKTNLSRFYLKTDFYPVFYDIHSILKEGDNIMSSSSQKNKYKKGYDIFLMILQFFNETHEITKYILNTYSKYGKKLDIKFFENYLYDENDPFSFADFFSKIIDYNNDIGNIVAIISSDSAQFNQKDVYFIEPDLNTGEGNITFGEINYSLKHLDEMKKLSNCSNNKETIKCKINDLLNSMSKGHSTNNSILSKCIKNSHETLKAQLHELNLLSDLLDSSKLLEKFKFDEDEILDLFNDKYHEFFLDTFYKIQNFILGYNLMRDELNLAKNVLSYYDENLFKDEKFHVYDTSKHKTIYSKLEGIVKHNTLIMVPELLGYQPTDQLKILRQGKKNTKYNIYKTHTRTLFSIIKY